MDEVGTTAHDELPQRSSAASEGAPEAQSDGSGNDQESAPQVAVDEGHEDVSDQNDLSSSADSSGPDDSDEEITPPLSESLQQIQAAQLPDPPSLSREDAPSPPSQPPPQPRESESPRGSSPPTDPPPPSKEAPISHLCNPPLKPFSLFDGSNPSPFSSSSTREIPPSPHPSDASERVDNSDDNSDTTARTWRAEPIAPAFNSAVLNALARARGCPSTLTDAEFRTVSVIEVLRRGAEFKKFHNKSGQACARFVRLSDSCDALLWGPREGRMESQMDLATVRFVRGGASLVRARGAVEGGLCFVVEGAERRLMLQAKDAATWGVWLDGLELLVKVTR
jgi:hypothetical protein